MTNDGPVDPLTSLAENATTMHEFMTSYVAAGFTRIEAMQVVCTIISEGMRVAYQSGPRDDGA